MLTFTTAEHSAPRHANHIFNAIHASMRQWGSSLNHNGMSFFLASVPAGTQFFHGTDKSTPVIGTDWLAFEPEHAMVFAGMHGHPHHGPPPKFDDYDNVNDSPSHRQELRRREPHHAESDGRRTSPEVEDAAQEGAGYLHTYAAAKDLRLLYIDGMSAGKTVKGTLDSQDVLLFNGSLEDAPSKPGPGSGPGSEGERARLACELAQDTWEGRIDGVLRMEAGFEVILCSFERDLIPVRITQVKSKSREGDEGIHRPNNEEHSGSRADDGKRRKGPGAGGPPGSGTWMRAIADRYHGIGGSRVSLNYDNFVTAFAYDIDLFPSNSSLPRLTGLSQMKMDFIRQDLTSLILNHEAADPSWNWQTTADMLVTRYSNELSYYVSGKIISLEDLHTEIERLLAPFIDYGDRNTDLEVDRCAMHSMPLRANMSTLAARAVHSIARTTCGTLLDVWETRELKLAVEKIQVLVDYLAWTTWKECRGCADNEICVVPIWPMGSVEDYERPQCRNASNPYNGEGESYWGGLHR